MTPQPPTLREQVEQALSDNVLADMRPDVRGVCDRGCMCEDCRLLRRQHVAEFLAPVLPVLAQADAERNALRAALERVTRFIESEIADGKREMSRATDNGSEQFYLGELLGLKRVQCAIAAFGAAPPPSETPQGGSK